MKLLTKPFRILNLLFIGISVLGINFLMSSCEVSSKLTHQVSYIDLGFSSNQLEQKGLALLPIVAGSGVEGYRRPFGEAMNKVASGALQNFMPWNTTLDKLNESELVSEYNNAILSYQETGIIDRSTLRKMADATGHNYFFFVQLAPPQVNTDVSYNYVTGSTNTIQTNSVNAFGLVWSAFDGDVVWEGSAAANVTTGPYSYTKETDMERANMVARTLMQSLLNNAQ